MNIIKIASYKPIVDWIWDDGKTMKGSAFEIRVVMVWRV